MSTLLIAAAAALAVVYLALALLARTEVWIDHSVEVDAPLEAVWAYGSDSRAAAEWSVFFHHITPADGPGAVPDGAVGAFRVCYRNADERGMTWDETTEEITHAAHRRIRTFNLVGFPFGALARAQEFDVHQHYEAIGETRARLTFRSRLLRRPGVGLLIAWPFVSATYSVFGAPAGQVVFVWNLENIKAAVEAHHAGVGYVRPHAYSRVLPWESRPLRWWLQDRVRHLRRRPVPPAPAPAAGDAARAVGRPPATT